MANQKRPLPGNLAPASDSPRAPQRIDRNPPPGMYTTRQSPRSARQRWDNRAPVASIEDFSPSPPGVTGPSAAQFAPGVNSPGMDRSMSLASDEKYPTTQALITDTLGPSPPRPSPAPGRNPHHSSSGSLSRPPPRAPAGRAAQSQLPPSGSQAPSISSVPSSRTNSTDGRYTLPAVPSRPPSGKAPRSSSSSAISAAAAAAGGEPPGVHSNKGMMRPRESGYSSTTSTATGRPHTDSYPSRGTVSTGANIDANIDNVPGAVRRPMSFVKALEMSDQLQVSQDKRQTRPKLSTPQEEAETRQMYGSSYEISV